MCSGHPNLEHLAYHGDTENTEVFIGISVISVVRIVRRRIVQQYFDHYKNGENVYGLKFEPIE